MQGLTRAGPVVEENNLTVGLWVHETLRVFYDRLINDEDRTWLTGLLSSMSFPPSLHATLLNFSSLDAIPVRHPNQTNLGLLKIGSICPVQFDAHLDNAVAFQSIAEGKRMVQSALYQQRLHAS